jgi:serine/threonine protein kinase
MAPTTDPDGSVLGLDPRLFKPYVIVKPIGEGSFAHVYLAHNEGAQQNFAIKVLRPRLAEFPHERQTFLEEARRLYRISQDRVIAVRHVDSDGDVPWFVMDFAEHGTLAGWVETLKKQRSFDLTLEQLVGLGSELCDCLSALHHYSVVHYDLKPHNVLIRGLGESADQKRGRRYRLPPDQRLMLGDLGFARTSGGVSDRLAGTPKYIAPEVFEDRGSSRSDLFALGLMLYEFAHPVIEGTAVRAYDGRRPTSDQRSFESLADTSMWGPYQSLVPVRPDLPRAFDDIIRRTVAPDPDERYANANDVRNALEGLLRRAIPPGQAERADKVVKGVADIVSATRERIAGRTGADVHHEQLNAALHRLRRRPRVAVQSPGAEWSRFTLFLAGEPVTAVAPAPYGSVISHLREGDPEKATVDFHRGTSSWVRLERDSDRNLAAALPTEGVWQLTLELDHPALGDLELVDVPTAGAEEDQVSHAISVADLVVALVTGPEDAARILPGLRDAARRSPAGPCGLIAVDVGETTFGPRAGVHAAIEDLGFQQALGSASAGLSLRVYFQQLLEGATGRYIAASAALALCETASLGANDWSIAKAFIDARDWLESEYPELRELRYLREEVRGGFDMPPAYARELRHTLSQPTPAGKLRLRSDHADVDSVRKMAEERLFGWIAALADGSIPARSADAARVVVATLRRLQDAEDV